MTIQNKCSANNMWTGTYRRNGIAQFEITTFCGIVITLPSFNFTHMRNARSCCATQHHRLHSFWGFFFEWQRKSNRKKKTVRKPFVACGFIAKIATFDHFCISLGANPRKLMDLLGCYCYHFRKVHRDKKIIFWIRKMNPKSVQFYMKIKIFATLFPIFYLIYCRP